jgi:Fur family ferric uptake transcriptional regulator
VPAVARRKPQQSILLDVVRAWHGSFSALELFDAARERSPRLGLATVYRALDRLERDGIVQRLSGSAGAADRFVVCDASHHHHHLICTSCGSVEETELCSAPPARELAARHGFVARSHQADIYGLCRRCAP